MKAMILAAGFGTRMLPHTKRIPKPLMPVLDRTLLEVAIETAKGANPDMIVVNAHHLADRLESFVKERDFGLEVAVSREEEILGTGGGIKAAEKWLGGDDFAVVNSDIITTVDWDGMYAQHKKASALATLLLRESHGDEGYGALCIDGGNRVCRYLSASNDAYAPDMASFMFTGVSILSDGIFGLIPGGRPVDISREVYQPIVKESGALFGFVTSNRWDDAGETVAYHKVVMDMLKADPGIARTFGIVRPGAKIVPPVYIHPLAKIEAGCVIGPHAAIHAGAVLSRGARVSNSVILPNSSVERGATLDGVVK